MGVSKVVYGNNTLVDLTNDTVSPETLLEGETAHDKSGTPITGTLSVPDAKKIDYDNSNTGLPAKVQGAIDKTTSNITALDTVELTATAAHAHATGSTFLWIGQLVKVTTAIAVGDTIALGTNVTETNVMELMSDVNAAIGTLNSNTIKNNVASQSINANSGITKLTVNDSTNHSAYISADNEGGNLALVKDGCKAEIDTHAMKTDGTGYARLHISVSGNLLKIFQFKQDGSFIDGNGISTTNLNKKISGYEDVVIRDTDTSHHYTMSAYSHVDFQLDLENNINFIGYSVLTNSNSNLIVSMVSKSGNNITFRFYNPTNTTQVIGETVMILKKLVS